MTPANSALMSPSSDSKFVPRTRKPSRSARHHALGPRHLRRTRGVHLAVRVFFSPCLSGAGVLPPPPPLDGDIPTVGGKELWSGVDHFKSPYLTASLEASPGSCFEFKTADRLLHHLYGRTNRARSFHVSRGEDPRDPRLAPPPGQGKVLSHADPVTDPIPTHAMGLLIGRGLQWHPPSMSFYLGFWLILHGLNFHLGHLLTLTLGLSTLLGIRLINERSCYWTLRLPAPTSPPSPMNCWTGIIPTTQPQSEC
uniref:Uncharacterized protein n=1 Tax=Ananas comosus var. bracteatus TaxID=296719 RepID=A0A6V7P552_ANACO|nr:unnamed protein product [Ananas comosus var. bracteatus]